MSIRLDTAYITGVNGGDPRWYFNPDHPDAHPDAVAEYQRGVAARACKPGLPVQNETPPGAFLGYTVDGGEMAFQAADGKIRFALTPQGRCSRCAGTGMQPPIGQWPCQDCNPQSRAVPALSGEFPGLGKWQMTGDTGPDFAAFTLLEPSLYNVIVIDGGKCCGGVIEEIEIFAASNRQHIEIPNWHILLSALPPRKVIGDYAVGPHGVKFQVKDCGIHLNIMANGYPLIGINDKQIWLEVCGPLWKKGADDVWLLRGEG